MFQRRDTEALVRKLILTYVLQTRSSVIIDYKLCVYSRRTCFPSINALAYFKAEIIEPVLTNINFCSVQNH